MRQARGQCKCLRFKSEGEVPCLPAQLRGSKCRDYEKELACCFLVANEQGSFTTPFFVSFTDEERLIGESLGFEPLVIRCFRL